MTAAMRSNGERHKDKVPDPDQDKGHDKDSPETPPRTPRRPVFPKPSFHASKRRGLTMKRMEGRGASERE
jgi:hypothetical protein